MSESLKEYAHRNNARILMVPNELTKETLLAHERKILVMGFGYLITMNVPLLTYTSDPSFGWRHKSFPRKWKDNNGVMLVPTFTKMPDTAKAYIHMVKTETEGQFARLHVTEDLMHRVLR